MGMYSTISPLSGKLYDFEIEGETPNQEEFDKIQNYISTDGNYNQEVPAAPEEDEGGLLTFGKSTAGGFLSSLAQIPGGISALGEYVGGYDIGSTDFGKAAQNWSNEAALGLQDTFDMNESISSKSGQAAGSLLSFFIPGTFVAKGASLLGAGARVAGASALGTMATQGAALQTSDQLNRMANFIENGGEIDEQTKRDAVGLSALLGTTEALPFAPMFRTLGTTMRILKKVPKADIDKALMTIGGKLKRSFGAGIAEGAQELGAGIVQDLIEQGLYNPDLEVGQSAYDDAVYGGGAGAALNLIVDSVRGRQLNKFYKKGMQLDEDLKNLNREATQRQKNYENYAESLKPTLLLEGPKKDIPETQEQRLLQGPSQKIEKSIAPRAIEDLRTRGEKSASATMAAARETTQPLNNISLQNLPKDEALRIAQRRQMRGADPSADVSIDELENTIGASAARRETAKQKPILTEQEKDIYYSPSGQENQMTDQEVDSKNKEASIIVEDLAVNGKLNKNTLRKALNDSFGGSIKITNTDVDTYLKLLEEDGVVLKDKKGRYVKADQRALDIKAKSEAIKQRGKEILNLQNKAMSEEEIDNLAIEYMALKNEADALESASEKAKTEKTEQVKSEDVIPDYTSKRTSDQASKSPYTDAYKLKLTSVLNNLKQQLNDMGLGDIRLEGESIISNQYGKEDASLEGYFGSTPEGKRIIGLAMDLYDPNLTEAQLTKKLSGVMNHEIIHALKNMGAFTDAEYDILVKAAIKRKYVGLEKGKFVKKEYSYMERASALYKDQGLTEEGIQEEAVAEMFRDYADGKLKVVAKPKSIFDKIIRFLKAIFTSNYDAGFTESNQIFANILSTKTEVEIKRKQSVPKSARSLTKYSTAGIAAGYIRPELGNTERIKQSFKDVTTRIDALTEASEKLYQGKINYAQYDKLVNDVKPIVPYETVPAPATINEMREALAGEKKKAIINKLQEIPEGTRIKLRLDIPAYTTKGTWVPTIHNMAGKAISHESTAIITNADFTMSEADQNKGLDIARRKPFGAEFRETGDITKAKRMTKSPYATISGDLVQTTPDNSFAEAQAAMNDPTFIQVGFDPERHSYFYDRTTTQPVVSAERVIQVGPLVLAKNPVFEGKEQFKYSKISNKPQSLENRLLGFIRDNPDGFTVDPDTLEVPNKGFAVAPVKEAEMVIRAENLTLDDVMQFAKNLKLMTEISGKKLYAGGWASDGIYYLDATMVIEDLNEALYVAEEGNQLAIFDLGEFNEIQTPEGVEGLKNAGTYSSEARAISGRDIRKLAEEFSKARDRGSAEQKIDKKYSSIARAKSTLDPNGRPLIDSTIVNEYDKKGNILPQPEYQTDPTKANIAVANKVLKLDALANHQIKRGGIVFDIHSKKAVEREEARENVAIMMAAEAEKALEQGDNAIGWYDKTLKAAKKAVSIIHPEILTDKDANLAFDFALSVTSNGMGVLFNFKHAEEQYAAWKASTNGRFPKKGWGKRSSAMKKAFLFYNAMKDNGVSTQEFIDFMDMETTPSQLKQNQFVKELKITISGGESANTPVTGAFVIGPKIGHGFYQNLRGNYDNLTMDIWFMRAINRLTGDVFKKPPTQKTLDRNLERVLLALDGRKQSAKQNEEPTDNELTELDRELIDRTQEALSMDITNANNALLFSEQFVKEYQSFRKEFESEGYQAGNMRFGTKLPDKSELQLATETHFNNTQTQEQEAPRGAADRAAMREIVNRARAILEADTGIKITNADFQALLWYAEKRFFEKQGVSKGTGDDNDYLDGAIYLLKLKGFENGEISDTLPEAERTRVYSRISAGRGDGQLREGDDSIIEREQKEEALPVDPDFDPYENLPAEEASRLEEASLDYKYSQIAGNPRALDDPNYPIRLPQRFLGRKTAGLGGYKYKPSYPYGNPNQYGYAKTMNGVNEIVVVPQGDHFPLENRKGKYGGYGYQHIFGERFNEDGIKLPTHAESILKYHTVIDGDPLNLLFDTMEEYRKYNRDISEGLYKDGSIRRPKDYGIRVFPDGGVGNNDIRIEWDNAPLALPVKMIPNANGRFPDGSSMSKDKYGKPWTRQNPRPQEIKPQERTLVLSLKFEPKGFKSVKKVSPKSFADNVAQAFAPREYEWRSLYQVRTFFTKPQNTAIKDKFKYSTISSNPAQTTSPNSEEFVQDMNQKAQNMTYDNLSKFIAKGLGVFYEEDVAKARAQRILTYFQDAMLPVGSMIDELRKNGFTITDAMDSYMQEANYSGIVGDKVTKVQEELFEPMINVMDTLNISEEKIQELRDIKGSAGSTGFYDSIEKDYVGKKLAMTDAVLYAFHARQRNAYIKQKTGGKTVTGSGMTGTEADQIIDWYNSLDKTEIAKFEEIREFARKINEDTIDRRIEAGLLPADARDPNRQPPIIIYTDGSYVPLQGDSDIEVESILDSQYGRKRVFTNFFGAKGREDKSARGRAGINDYAENIVASLMAQNNNSIDRGERNKVGQSFGRLVEGLEEQPDGSMAINDSLAKEMKEIAEEITNLNSQQRNQRGVKPENIFTYKENGVERDFLIKDPRIAKSMNGALTPQQNAAIFRYMGKFNRFLSAVNTTYNPSFVIPNFARDLETAGINAQEYDEKGFTKEVMKGTPSAVIGIGKLLFDKNAVNKWTDIYKEYVSAGGKNATNQMGDVKDQIDNIDNIIGDISDSGIKQKLGLNRNQFVGKNARSLLSMLDNANTAVENGVRVSLYKSLRDRGVSKSRAALAARNITVNFAKGGENKAVMNSMYLFYNASLQGSMALVNAATRSSKVRKMWAGLMVYGIMQDTINGLFSGDEDEDGISDYDEIPRHILEHNIIVPTLGLTGDKHITIPMAYGLNMAVNFGRSLSRMGRGEYTPGEAMRSIVGTTVESISPIGAYDNFLNFAAPTVFDPFISVGINEDYKGDPIYKESPTYASVAKANSSQYWSNTSSIAKTIASSVNSLTGGDDIKGGLIDMSPDIIEYWFGTFTGGAGRFAMRSLEAPVDIYDALQGDFEGSLINSIPLARKVITTPSPRADTGNYLDNRQDLFTLIAQLDMAKRSGDKEAVASIYENNKKQISIVGRMKAIDNARNRMQRQIKEIERNPQIPENTKRKIIRIRRDKINELQQMGLILMRSAGYKKAG